MKSTNIRLISAGAGTGKTFRLIKELSAFLTGNNKTYHPSEIIATTFTRAAAGELKNRIREKILEHGDMEIVPQLDQALVGTVNSVSQQLVSLFSFEIGLSPTLTVIDDEEKDVLYQHALSASLNLVTLNEMDKVAERFSIERKDIRNVIKNISDNARNNSIDAKQMERSRDDSVQSLTAVLPKPNKDQQKIRAAIQKIIPSLRKRAKEVKDDNQTTMGSLDTLEEFNYKLQRGFNIPWADWATCSNIGCNAKSRDAKIFDEVKELMQAHMRFPEFQNDLISYIKLCFDAAVTSMEAYAALKNERGLVDFVDQETILLHALDDIRIQKRFREQFKILFVDEFQDTSPLQLSLFLKISSLVEKVVWVGDSKQAIYGFRNSDAKLINTVTEALGKPDPKDILQTSYRSRPELVEIVNDLFLSAFKNTDKILSKEQIVLKPDRTENKQLKASFQLWGFQWQPSSGKWDSNEKYQGHLAARVAEFLSEEPLIEVRETKSVRRIKPGDISILCRTNKNCTGIANALRNQGLQAVVSNAGLNLTAEWRFLKACLHLLVDEKDSLSKFEIEFLTRADHDISALLVDRLLFLKAVGDDPERKKKWLNDHPIIQWINKHRKSLLSESISGIIRLMYAGLDFNNQVMKWGNSAQRHTNLQQILNYSVEFEDYCLKMALLPNVHGFLSWFDALSDNEQDKRGLITNEFSVNVLTYHAAKGLEWPVVILCDQDAQRDPDVFSVRVNANDKIDFNDPLKDRSIRFWPWPYKTSVYGMKSGFQEFKDCCENSVDYATLGTKERTEALRLLYVGFTRARDYLIIPFKVKSEDCYLKPIAENGISSFIEIGEKVIDKIIPKNKLFTQPLRLWITAYDDYAEKINITNKTAETYQQQTIKEYPPFYITPSGSKPAEDITFKEGVEIHSAFEDEKIDVEESEFGSFIHRVFCAYDTVMTKDQTNELIKRLADCYQVEAPKLKAKLLDRLPEFYGWIEKEFKPIKLHKELPLMMEANGQLVDGIADLVIETADEVILIDYKTFNGDAASMKGKLATFSGQLKLYKEILKKGFPGKKIIGGIYFVMKGELAWVKE
jgi:ATP-dependent exoDNAse (exonuclease V) beta subunit